MQDKTCPKCQFQNSSAYSFCEKCGSNLALRACPDCQHLNEPDYQFCLRCGTSLELNICSSCNFVNEKDYLFCNNCGNRLTTTADPLAESPSVASSGAETSQPEVDSTSSRQTGPREHWTKVSGFSESETHHFPKRPKRPSFVGRVLRGGLRLIVGIPIGFIMGTLLNLLYKWAYYAISHLF